MFSPLVSLFETYTVPPYGPLSEHSSTSFVLFLLYSSSFPNCQTDSELIQSLAMKLKLKQQLKQHLQQQQQLS